MNFYSKKLNFKIKKLKIKILKIMIPEELQKKMDEQAFEFEDDYKDDYLNVRYCFKGGFTAAYAHLAPLVEWNDVRERLPEDNRSVIVKTDTDRKYVAWYLDYTKEWVLNKTPIQILSEEAAESLKNVTHWRQIEL